MDMEEEAVILRATGFPTDFVNTLLASSGMFPHSLWIIPSRTGSLERGRWWSSIIVKRIALFPNNVERLACNGYYRELYLDLRRGSLTPGPTRV